MREQIVPMFSTPLGIYRWNDDKLAELKDLTRELMAKRAVEHGVDGCPLSNDLLHFWNTSGNSFLKEDHPLIKEFEKFLSESYTDFTQNVYNWNVTEDHFITECWVNVQRKNGWQYKHSHSNCFVSGTFYLNFPEGSPGITFTHFSKEKTSPYLSPNPRKPNQWNSETLTMMPKEGILFLWSSNLTHETEIITDDIRRVSISMNFVPSVIDTGVYRLRLSQ